MFIKRILTVIAVAAVTSSYSQQKDYAYTALPFTIVHLTDNFWLPRIKINHTVTIPASFQRCERAGRVKNFEMAATKSGKSRKKSRI